MITKTRLLEIANTVLEQSKGQYTVRALSRTFTAYPFVTNGVAIPAKVQQFAVESFSIPPAKHVVSIARSAEGFSVWCGDRLTEGMLPSHETFKRVLDAQALVPACKAKTAGAQMLKSIGLYPDTSPCHFWDIWRTRKNVCPHVAVVFRYIQSFPGGLAQFVNSLDRAYDSLMAPTDVPASPSNEPAPLSQATPERGELIAFVMALTAPLGGLSSSEYVQLNALLSKVANPSRPHPNQD